MGAPGRLWAGGEAGGRDARRRLCGHPGKTQALDRRQGSGVREEEVIEKIWGGEPTAMELSMEEGWGGRAGQGEARASPMGAPV